MGVKLDWSLFMSMIFVIRVQLGLKQLGVVL